MNRRRLLQALAAIAVLVALGCAGEPEPNAYDYRTGETFYMDDLPKGVEFAIVYYDGSITYRMSQAYIDSTYFGQRAATAIQEMIDDSTQVSR